MPELPEVETVRRGLERTVSGWCITDTLVANAKVLRGQSPETLQERVVGRRIERIDRRGKYLLVRLGSDSNSPASYSICIHLKMRGQMAVEAAGSEPQKYHCVTLFVENESGDRAAVRFYDAWTWGELRALTDEELAVEAPALQAMGPEPLGDDWNGAALAEALKKRRTPIKPTLLDQTVVAGVGNIYADEALYRARIAPRRPANTLTAEEANALAREIKQVLTEAVAGGGTTSDNFFDTSGMAGSYVPRVYERGGQPCQECGTTLTRIRLAGRSAVFCERCQPETGTA